MVWVNEGQDLGLLKQEWFDQIGSTAGTGVGGNGAAAAAAAATNVTTTATIVSAPGSSHTPSGTVHLPTRLVVKKEPQVRKVSCVSLYHQ